MASRKKQDGAPPASTEDRVLTPAAVDEDERFDRLSRPESLDKMIGPFVRPTSRQLDVASLATPKVWKGGANVVQVGVAQPLLVSTPRGKYEKLKATMDLPKSLEAPIAKGQKIGMVKVSLDGKVIAQSPLVALSAVEEGGFFKRLWHELLMWWQD